MGDSYIMAKRILFSFPLLFGTFFLGYCLAPRFHITDPPAPAIVTTVAPITKEPEIPITPRPATTAQLEMIDEVNNLYEDPSKNSVHLHETGEFEPESFPVKNGETWLGLFEENGKYSVRRTAVTISGPPRNTTRADVPGANKPIFLVKNAPMIREGRVNTVFRGVDDTITNDFGHRGIEVYGGLDVVGSVMRFAEISIGCTPKVEGASRSRVETDCLRFVTHRAFEVLFLQKRVAPLAPECSGFRLQTNRF